MSEDPKTVCTPIIDNKLFRDRFLMTDRVRVAKGDLEQLISGPDPCETMPHHGVRKSRNPLWRLSKPVAL